MDAPHARTQVQDGDTLWSLGSKYGVDTATFARANRVDSLGGGLQVGAVLTVPDRAVVENGDSLWTVAQSYECDFQSVRN